MVNVEYNYKIYYRPNRFTKIGRQREDWLINASKEYGIEPSVRLFDRILQDIDKISAYRAQKRAEALRRKEEADVELRKLVSGDI